jgi:hypothetical protein
MRHLFILEIVPDSHRPRGHQRDIPASKQRQQVCSKLRTHSLALRACQNLIRDREWYNEAEALRHLSNSSVQEARVSFKDGKPALPGL